MDPEEQTARARQGIEVAFQPLAGETGINFEQTSSKRISGILWR
jgi:hypothetical protein